MELILTELPQLQTTSLPALLSGVPALNPALNLVAAAGAGQGAGPNHLAGFG